MELSSLPKLTLGYVLNPINNERLRRYIELQALKLVAVELQDTRSLKMLNRIKIKNPAHELFLQYVSTYNEFERVRNAQTAESVNAIAEELRGIASTIADILQETSVREEDFMEQARKAKTPEAEKLKLEFRYLKVALNNLFKFNLPTEEKLQ